MLLVLVNAGISHLMARRGAEWPSLAVEFVVLAVVNTVLLTGFATLVGETALNRVTAWFFGLLLTMIIVLFDRFRAERLDRIQPALAQHHRRSVSLRRQKPPSALTDPVRATGAARGCVSARCGKPPSGLTDPVRPMGCGAPTGRGTWR